MLIFIGQGHNSFFRITIKAIQVSGFYWVKKWDWDQYVDVLRVFIIGSRDSGQSKLFVFTRG